MPWLQLALISGQRLRSKDGAPCSLDFSKFRMSEGCWPPAEAEAYVPLEDGLVLEVASGLVLVPLVVLLELDVLPWADAPLGLKLRSCHGTGTSLLSAEMTANSIRPVVGFSVTSSMRPTSSPVLLLTGAPMILVLRKVCC